MDCEDPKAPQNQGRWGLGLGFGVQGLVLFSVELWGFGGPLFLIGLRREPDPTYSGRAVWKL